MDIALSMDVEIGNNTLTEERNDKEKSEMDTKTVVEMPGPIGLRTNSIESVPAGYI